MGCLGMTRGKPKGAGPDSQVPDYEGSVGKRFAQAMKAFSIPKQLATTGSLKLESKPKGYYVTPESRTYKTWSFFMVAMAMYSTLFTPFQFAFFVGLPRALWILDLVSQVPFILDVILQFFTAYKDRETFKIITDRKKIALRYAKKRFIIDLLCCLPWDSIYKGTGHHEAVRCLVWIREYRFLRVLAFFTEVEKNIRVNYFLTRILKLITVEIFVCHFAACFYFYLATTVKARSESYTWIGSLTLGDFSYTDFRSIDVGKLYCTSMYWSMQAITTVGYGDIHAVNIREMIFVMIFISCNMLIGAYLLGNITALVVKASATQLFRDKMASLHTYMNKHQLPPQVKKQMKNHLLLQFESGVLTEDEIVGDLPSTVRSKIAGSIYKHVVRKVPIFKGCSNEFLDEIVNRVEEEHYLPGEVVTHQGRDTSNFFIVFHGTLEEVLVHESGKVELIKQLGPETIFGEVGVLCSTPQPFTVRVTDLSRLLRLNKQNFTDLVQIYYNDGRLVINNLLEYRNTDARIGQIASDVTFLVAKHAAELTLIVIEAASNGDLEQIKHLVRQGANVARADYDGRTPLHLASARGNDEMALYLIREGADVNALDKFGISPLFEAVKGGHDSCISALMEQGALLQLSESGPYLCKAVDKDKTDLLRRLLEAGADPSSADYDRRTALHIAAADGKTTMAKMLIDAGADIHYKDRWDRTPLDEAKRRDDKSGVEILKDAAEKRQLSLKSEPQSKLSDRGSGRSTTGNLSSKRSLAFSIRPASDRELRTFSDLSQASHASIMDPASASADYRNLSIRSKNRPPRPERPSFDSSTEPSTPRKRATIFPFHPSTPSHEQTPGIVSWMPSHIAGVFEITKQHFGIHGSKVLNQVGGIITDAELIVDNDKLYVVE